MGQSTQSGTRSIAAQVKRRIPRTRYPHGAERDLLSLLLQALREWFKSLRAGILAAWRSRNDAERNDSPFDGVFDAARNRWGLFASQVKPLLARIAAQVDRVAEISFMRQTEAALPDMSISLAQGFLPFGEIQGEVDTFTRQAALLIKDIGDKAARDIEIAVQNAVSTGTSTKKLAELITEQHGYAKNRAALIARDQIGKLNGNIHRIRQTSAGIDRYEWLSMGDARVRPAHAKRDGEVFSWSKPPADGHPGQAIRCRCTPIPVFDDFNPLRL